MKKQENRLIWADITRIIAIYLVMLVHSVVFPQQVTAHTDLTVFVLFAIAKTSVPVFVMLSGAFLLPKKESYRMVFRKRLLRLLIPWITWTILFVFWHIYSGQTNVQSLSDLLKLGRNLFLSFWFLPMLFVLYLFIYALRLFYQSAQTRDLLIIVLLWFVGVSLLPYVHNTEAFPLSSDNGLVRQAVQFGGFFLLGGLLVKMSLHRATLPSCLVFLFGISWSVFSTVQASFNNQTVFTGVHFDYVSPGIVLASTGFFLFFLSMRKIFQDKLSEPVLRVIAPISKATLGIYLVHHLYLYPASLLFNRKPAADIVDAGMVVGMSFFLFAASSVTILFLQRIPLVKKIIT